MSQQLDLFAPRDDNFGVAAAARAPPVNASGLTDAALIAALPSATLAEARALAQEAGKRKLGAAVAALTALCHRFVGFGRDAEIPEQAAAFAALAEIGGGEAARSVAMMIAQGIVQGPTLVAALVAAARLGVALAPQVALPLLRLANPLARAAACDCLRAGPEATAALIDLLGDRETALAAACALARMGRVEARAPLKQSLQNPTPDVIEALSRVADEEAIVLLARLGRDRADLADCVLEALDDMEHPRASAATAALRRWRDERPGGK